MMKLAVFLSDWRRTEDSYERIKADKLGVILVGNGIYHAVMKEGGKDSPVLSKAGQASTFSRTISRPGDLPRRTSTKK
jgi:hypothetical protein